MWSQTKMIRSICFNLRFVDFLTRFQILGKELDFLLLTVVNFINIFYASFLYEFFAKAKM